MRTLVPQLSSGKLLTHQDVNEFRKKIEQLDTPAFNADIFSTGLEISSFYIRNGFVKFLDFSHKMLSDVGNCIRPYLKCFYSGIRYCPGLEPFWQQMSSPDFVDRIDTGAIKQDNKYYRSTWKTAFGIWATCERIEEGYCSIESISEQMVKDFGDCILPEIKSCYESAKGWFTQKNRDDILKKLGS